MIHPVTNDTSRATKNGATETCKRSGPSLALAWGVTIGEAILWGTLVWFFNDYWLMLPVRYRWAGILVLASLAAIGLIRLVRFYRRFFRFERGEGKQNAGKVPGEHCGYK